MQRMLLIRGHWATFHVTFAARIHTILNVDEKSDQSVDLKSRGYINVLPKLIPSICVDLLGLNSILFDLSLIHKYNIIGVGSDSKL